jgi:mannosyltransferase
MATTLSQPAQMRISKSQSPALWLIAALVILLIAAAVRLHLLGAQSLWNDEGSTYEQATRSFSAIAANAAHDIHPPGYYWLMAVWRTLTGSSEFSLRALSAFASVLTVALTYALGKRLYHPGAGWVAAIIVALNTFSIYYSQEARMYALLALWSVASLWTFVSLVQASPCHRWRAMRASPGVALALLNAAGLYTHYAYPAVMAAQGLLFLIALVSDLLIQRRTASDGLQSSLRLLGMYVAANLLTILLFLPWLPTALQQITNWPSTGEPIPFADAMTTIIGWLSFGITAETGQSSIALSFFLLFGLLSFPWQDGQRTWWRMLVPVVWVLVTLSGFLALGLFRPANLKFLLPAQIGVALWMGRGAWILWTLRPRRSAMIFQLAPKLAALIGTLSLIVALVRGLDPLYHAQDYQRDNYRAIVRMILSMATTEGADAVILNAPGQTEVFGYYFSESDHVYPLPIGMTVEVEATEQAVRDIISQYQRIYAVLWGTEERDPQNVVENTLNREAYEIDDRWFGSVRLARYVTPQPLSDPFASGAQFGAHITLERYALNGEPSEDSILLHPGDVLQLQLEWQTDAPLDRRYKVFVQMLDADGVLVEQRDSEPGGGTLPTVDWQPGEIIIDQHALILPETLKPAEYQLIVGLYDINSPMERLPIELRESTLSGNDTSPLQDYLRLIGISLQSRS